MPRQGPWFSDGSVFLIFCCNPVPRPKFLANGLDCDFFRNPVPRPRFLASGLNDRKWKEITIFLNFPYWNLKKNYVFLVFNENGKVFCRGKATGFRTARFFWFSVAIQSLGQNFWLADWTTIFFAIQSLGQNFWPADATIENEKKLIENERI